MEGSFENEEKGENCVNQDFLPFPQCFLFCEGNHFNLDRSNFFSNYKFLCSRKEGLRLSVYPSIGQSKFIPCNKSFYHVPLFFFCSCAKPCYKKKLLNVF